MRTTSFTRAARGCCTMRDHTIAWFTWFVGVAHSASAYTNTWAGGQELAKPHQGDSFPINSCHSSAWCYRPRRL